MIDLSKLSKKELDELAEKLQPILRKRFKKQFQKELLKIFYVGAIVGAIFGFIIGVSIWMSVKSDMLDFAQQLRKKAKDLQLKGDHYHANRCRQDADLIENVWNDDA